MSGPGSHFSHPEHAARVRQDLESQSGLDLAQFFEGAFADCPNPDLALTNIDRWLKATASPGLHLGNLLAAPGLSRLILLMLGSSQPLADALIQNPELASLLSDPTELERVPTAEGILAEGRSLLSASTSYTHGLDRLRFLKQRWTFPIAVADLSGRWPAEQVWRALSDLADATIQLAVEIVAKEYALRRSVDFEFPLMVVAFGKLGGQEVNFSSDVDLVYVMGSGLGEEAEQHVGRACEMLNRGLGDRMGRGSLYRVDLRLRPFGGAGPLVRSMGSVEAYYRSHAEDWEGMALIRSRPIVGPPDLRERWEALRERVCFRSQMSDFAIEGLLAMRERVEQGAPEADVKRGVGGIRDVEFLTQLRQMIGASRHPELRATSTCGALRALAQVGTLPQPVADELIEGYRFLRQVEHRCQLIGDQQTHSIPADPAGRRVLAHTLGSGSWHQFVELLDGWRARIRRTYKAQFMAGSPETDERASVAAALGEQAELAERWFDSLPESRAFYRSLHENADSLQRVQRVLHDAPALVPHFMKAVALTENLLSGEIEEDADLSARYARMPSDASPGLLADTMRGLWLTLATQRVLGPGTLDLSQALTNNLDQILSLVWARFGSAFDMVALGSYAGGRLGLESDADLVLLVADPSAHPVAEQRAQEMVAFLGQLKRLGAPLEIDLRLRPLGRQGLLVRTYDGFRAYERTGMEMWERFALSESRLLCGDPLAAQLVDQAAGALLLTAGRIDELMAMKRRIETERVQRNRYRRHVKLGYGGLTDIEWARRLSAMRGRASGSKEPWLLEHEVDLLQSAESFLLDIRASLFLLDFEHDVLPENPLKLGRLASGLGIDGANALLARYSEVTEAVRSIYERVVERLRR